MRDLVQQAVKADRLDRRLLVSRLADRLGPASEITVLGLGSEVRAAVVALLREAVVSARERGDVPAERKLLRAHLRAGSMESHERIRYAQLLVASPSPIDYFDATALVELAGLASRGSGVSGWAAALVQIKAFCELRPSQAPLINAQLAVARGSFAQGARNLTASSAPEVAK